MSSTHLNEWRWDCIELSTGGERGQSGALVLAKHYSNAQNGFDDEIACFC